MTALARRCGFLRENGVQRFREALEQHRQRVSAIYGSLFNEQDQAAQQQVNPEILYMLDAKSDPDLVKDMLAQRGLEDVERAFENLTMLRGGALKRNTTERSRRILARIAPPFCRRCWMRLTRTWPWPALNVFLRRCRAAQPPLPCWRRTVKH